MSEVKRPIKVNPIVGEDLSTAQRAQLLEKKKAILKGNKDKKR